MFQVLEDLKEGAVYMQGEKQVKANRMIDEMELQRGGGGGAGAGEETVTPKRRGTGGAGGGNENEKLKKIEKDLENLTERLGHFND